MEKLNIPSATQQILTEVVKGLTEKLRENLFSCIIYGSAVRGTFVPGVSDLNLLIILNESTPAAHQVIAQILTQKIRIEPFVIARKGMERSFEAFAIKFCSIKRHYRVLHGDDPLRDLIIDKKMLHFLTEQALRNLRLRSVHAYITLSHDRKRYLNYLVRIVPQVFTDISTAFRARDIEMPDDFRARIPVLVNHLGNSAMVLDDLLKLKGKKTPLTETEIFQMHNRLFGLLDSTISWIAK